MNRMPARQFLYDLLLGVLSFGTLTLAVLLCWEGAWPVGVFLGMVAALPAFAAVVASPLTPPSQRPGAKKATAKERRALAARDWPAPPGWLRVGWKVFGLTAGVAAGLGAGLLSLQLTAGSRLPVVWTKGLVEQAGDPAVGHWLGSSTVVRARDGQLDALELSSGQHAWSYRLPFGQRVAAMSRAVSDGVGLLRQLPEGGRSGRTAALELWSGRVLWQRPATGRPIRTWSDPPPASEVLAVAGPLALSAEGGSLTALGLRDGTPRWRRTVPATCRIQAVGGSRDQVVAVVGCTAGAGSVLALDPATGRVRWQRAVREVNQVGGAEVVSANPVVVRVQEARKDSTWHSVHYRPDGTPGLDHRHGPSGPDRSDAQPVQVAVVTGDQLVTFGYDDRTGHFGDYALESHSLVTGQQLWSAPLGEEVLIRALDLSGGSLVMAGNDSRIRRIDPRTGRLLADNETAEFGYEDDYQLRTLGDRYLLLRRSGKSGEPLVTVVRAVP